MKYFGNTTNLHFHLQTKNPTEYNNSAASKLSNSASNNKEQASSDDGNILMQAILEEHNLPFQI